MKTDSFKISRSNLMLSFVLSVVSGGLLALPFFNGDFWFFSWVGLAPLFFAWDKKTGKSTFVLSLVTGLVFFSCAIYWLIHVTLIGQILLIIYSSLYFGIFGLVAYQKRKSSSLFLLFFIPCIWVILEFVRSHLFTGFGWATLGYSQYKNLAIIQVADIAGSYIVSFVIVMVNFVVYKIMATDERRGLKFSLGIIAGIFVLIFSIYGSFKLTSSFKESEPIKVSVIQGSIPQELKWQEEARSYILEGYLGLTRQAAEDQPQLIIWPESSVPFLLEEDSLLFDDITDLVRKMRIPLLVGAISAKRGKLYNTAILISPDGSIKEQYEKLHLVPFGEYIPLKSIFGFAQDLAPIPIGDFTPGEDYQVFSLDKEEMKFSVLICFEDVFAQLSREFVKKGANILVNITNDAWFKISSAPYQHLQASVFRAVENRKFLIRAANTGVSCFIDPCGRIISRVSNAEGKDIFVRGYQTQYVKVNNLNTLYTKSGDIFVILCFAFAVLNLVNKKR